MTTATQQLRISVVVPTLNRAQYLRETIDSILDQSYPLIDCVVMDAGSTDDTLDILKSYGERITWRSGPDSGAAEAINKGWALTSGEIVAWINADDRWAPGCADIVASYFAGHPQTDVLYGACGIIDATSALVDTYPPAAWDLKHALLTCDHLINQAAAFMRRDAVERVGWLTRVWCHDHDLWLRMAQAGAKFDTVPQRLADARIWPDNLGNQAAVVIPAKIALTERFFATPNLQPELAALRKRSLSSAYLRGLDYLRPTQREALQLSQRVLRTDPTNAPWLMARLARRTVECSPRLHAVLKSIRRRFFPRR